MDTEHVRQTIIDSLPQFGVASTEPSWETFVIVDERYLGRRFEFLEIRAIWSLERNTIEFFDLNATAIGEISLLEPAVMT